jgi:phage shock protein PspC (stress-responsive transcriptional regulator)
MNKIISANINGFVFNIDELAYAKLKAYLDIIKQKVDNSEVSQDIENRIAELFNEKLKDGRTAIFDADVDDVMQQMGKPDEFAADDEEGENKSKDSNSSSSYFKQSNRKRLYRDEDDKVIGGVCSGIGAYFGLDPVIIRIGFAAAFLFFGSGFILYILLMIIMPKAVTPSEKLEMRGEPMDYKNLSKTVEKDFKDAYHRYRPEVKTGFHRFVQVAVRIGMVVLAIFIISIIIPSGFGLLTGIGIASWSLPTLSSYIFTSTNESILIIIGLILFILIPILGIFYSLLRLGFRFKPMPKVFSILLSLLWFTGFCLLAFSTYNIGKQFSTNSKINEIDTLSELTSNKTLILRCNSSENDSRIFYHDEDGESQVRIHNEQDMKEAIDQGISERVSLKIVNGFASVPVLKVSKIANGPSSYEASTTAKQIDYSYELRDSILYLDAVIQKGENQLWRNQRVRLTLEVPESYQLYIDESCNDLLDLNGRERKKLLGHYLHVDHRGFQIDDED